MRVRVKVRVRISVRVRVRVRARARVRVEVGLGFGLGLGFRMMFRRLEDQVAMGLRNYVMGLRRGRLVSVRIRG